MAKSKRSRQQNGAQHNQQQNEGQKLSLQDDIALTSQRHVERTARPTTTWTATTVSRSRPVDSWRSYTEDISNLQTLVAAHGASKLNAAASEFEPVSKKCRPPHSFTPYQHLSSSDGQNEKRILHQATLDSILQPVSGLQGPQTQPQTDQVGQNRVSHQVVPSIEPAVRNTRAHSAAFQENFMASQYRTRAPGSRPPDRRTFRRAMSTQNPEPPPAPVPTEAYKLQAGLDPITLQQPQRLLVIFDLNGTLLYRKNRANNPTSFTLRPGVHKLLDYVFEHHTVMMYTSAKPLNANAMVSKLLSTKQRSLLAATWSRDKLDLNSEQYNNKVQVYKKLEKVWNDPSIQAMAGERRCWDQSNTVLIDDSYLKAAAQPHNLLLVPEFIDDASIAKGSSIAKAKHKVEEAILQQLELTLEQLKWTCDVSRLIRSWQCTQKPQPTTSSQVDGTIDQLDTKPGEATDAEDNPQLLTPRSPKGETPDLGATAGTNATRVTGKDAPRQVVQARSESPIGESVWAEILGTNTNKTEEMPNTPKSMT